MFYELSIQFCKVLRNLLTITINKHSYNSSVPRRYFFCGSIVLFMSCVCHAFASVLCNLVVTCWERLTSWLLLVMFKRSSHVVANIYVISQVSTRNASRKRFKPVTCNLLAKMVLSYDSITFAQTMSIMISPFAYAIWLFFSILRCLQKKLLIVDICAQMQLSSLMIKTINVVERPMQPCIARHKVKVRVHLDSMHVRFYFSVPCVNYAFYLLLARVITLWNCLYLCH